MVLSFCVKSQLTTLRFKFEKGKVQRIAVNILWAKSKLYVTCIKWLQEGRKQDFDWKQTQDG